MSFTSQERRANTWRDIAGILGSTVGGVGTGAAVGNVPGAIIGGIAGLGLGVAGAVSDKSQRVAAEEDQEQLSKDMKSTDEMSDRMAEAGASSANLRRSARADAAAQASRSGLIGGEAGEYAREVDMQLAQAQQAQAPAVYAQAKSDERARRGQLLQQAGTQQMLIERQAQGGALEQVGAVAGDVIPLAMEYRDAQGRAPIGSGKSFEGMTDEDALDKYDSIIGREAEADYEMDASIDSANYASQYKEAYDPELTFKQTVDIPLVEQIVTDNMATIYHGQDPAKAADDISEQYLISGKTFEDPEWGFIVGAVDAETRQYLLQMEQTYKGNQ